MNGQASTTARPRNNSFIWVFILCQTHRQRGIDRALQACVVGLSARRSKEIASSDAGMERLRRNQVLRLQLLDIER